MNRRDVLTFLAGISPALRLRGTLAQDATPAAGDDWAHPEWFANPGWLADRISDPAIRILALTPASEFATGHLPGAAQIDWSDLNLTDSSDATVAAWRTDVEGKLTALGVSTDNTVVIYDGGTFYASRLWWILDQLGHADKRIINGGLRAWTESGGKTEVGQAKPDAASEPYTGTPNEAALARIDDVAAVSESGDGVLIDARSTEEFASGHIPRAINIPFTENAIPNGGGHWKSPADLRAMYEGSGITPDLPVIAYCSTGVRSAATYVTLKALGYEDVRLYSASFAEWSSDSSRPVETGDEP